MDIWKKRNGSCCVNNDIWLETFDYGFVCLGMQSATPSLQELYNHFIYEGVEVLNIGDSAQTRRIIEGVKEGRDILVALERQDFI